MKVVPNNNGRSSSKYCNNQGDNDVPCTVHISDALGALPFVHLCDALEIFHLAFLTPALQSLTYTLLAREIFTQNVTFFFKFVYDLRTLLRCL